MQDSSHKTANNKKMVTIFVLSCDIMLISILCFIHVIWRGQTKLTWRSFYHVDPYTLLPSGYYHRNLWGRLTISGHHQSRVMVIISFNVHNKTNMGLHSKKLAFEFGFLKLMFPLINIWPYPPLGLKSCVGPASFKFFNSF